MDGQQSARVNVDDETWVAFRVLAVRQGRSIDDYLGELVDVELVEQDDRRGPTSRPPIIESTDVDGVRDTADGGAADREVAPHRAGPPGRRRAVDSLARRRAVRPRGLTGSSRLPGARTSAIRRCHPNACPSHIAHAPTSGPPSCSGRSELPSCRGLALDAVDGHPTWSRSCKAHHRSDLGEDHSRDRAQAAGSSTT